MPPLLFVTFLTALTVVWLLVLQRRSELSRMARTMQERHKARRAGTHRAALQHPKIDLSRCMGCGACITACPEQGVLDMLHGQAIVVHGANCIGHGHCETACPAGAIRLGWEALEERRDLPALTSELEAPGQPGLFLAGEVTGRGLIRNAIDQGVDVARTVQARFAQEGERPGSETARDLVVVGAGPAGLSCAIEAKQRGLDVVLLEQGHFGGTIAHFPREKLILTQAVDLPGYGRLEAASYGRDELLGIWNRAVANSDVEIAEETSYQGLSFGEESLWEVRTDGDVMRSRAVCLALGRRGKPNELGVPGEDLTKVRYGLLEARSIRARRILVVGGGDSAAETALALALEPSNRVTLAHRSADLSRVAARQRTGLENACREGRLRIMENTVVTSIEGESVHLLRNGTERVRLTNDDVFVMIGAQPPVPLLESSGISFDPQERLQLQAGTATGGEQADRKRLIGSLGSALLLGVALAAWVLWNWSYYGLDLAQRPLTDQHASLRPSGSIGLAFGWFAIVLFVTNLAYVLKRLRNFPWGLGLPRHWLSVHITTGLLLLPIVLLHAGMHLGDTPGGHGLIVLVVLVITGAVGRFIYAYLPRAVSGRDLEFEEVRRELDALQDDLEQTDMALAARVQQIASDLVAGVRWRGGTFTRVWGLIQSPARLRVASHRLKQEAEAQGLDKSQVQQILHLLARAERHSRLAAHYDDLRALLSGWRHLHFWIAALFLLLVIRHVWDAWKYGELWPW